MNVCLLATYLHENYFFDLVNTVIFERLYLKNLDHTVSQYYLFVSSAVERLAPIVDTFTKCVIVLHMLNSLHVGNLGSRCVMFCFSALVSITVLAFNPLRRIDCDSSLGVL